MKVILNPPGPDTPGFNRRMMLIASFEEARNENRLTAKVYGDLMKFLADFVDFEYAGDESPHPTKYDAMLELSENQTMELLSAFKGMSNTEQPMPEGMEGTKVDAQIPPQN